MRVWMWALVGAVLAGVTGAGWLLAVRNGEWSMGDTLLSAQAEEAPRPTPPAASAPVTISFVGDILLADRPGALAAAHGTPWLFDGLGDALTGDALTIGNLECAVATTGAAADKQFTFRADPDLLPGLRDAGVDAVTLANNHTLDFGRAALRETLTHLADARIPAAGAGEDDDAAYAPVFLTAGTQPVALVAASRVLPATSWYARANTPGIAAAYDPSRLLASIHAARAPGRIVVAYLHWGVEKDAMPNATQRQLARQCIDAGADLVIGSHPHVLQGFEYYRGKLIAYSLGNFVFGGAQRPTAILQTTFRDGVLVEARALPCTVERSRPRLLATPEARAAVWQLLQERSSGAFLAKEGVILGTR